MLQAERKMLELSVPISLMTKEHFGDALADVPCDPTAVANKQAVTRSKVTDFAAGMLCYSTPAR